MNKIVGTILSTVFGLAFLAAGFFGVAAEYRTTPVHTTHLVLFLLLGLLGAVLMPWVGPIIFGKLRDGVDIAGPFIPTFGRRASQGEISAATENPLAGKGTIDDGGAP